MSDNGNGRIVTDLEALEIVRDHLGDVRSMLDHAAATATTLASLVENARETLSQIETAYKQWGIAARIEETGK